MSSVFLPSPSGCLLMAHGIEVFVVNSIWAIVKQCEVCFFSEGLLKALNTQVSIIKCQEGKRQFDAFSKQIWPWKLFLWCIFTWPVFWESLWEISWYLNPLLNNHRSKLPHKETKATQCAGLCFDALREWLVSLVGTQWPESHPLPDFPQLPAGFELAGNIPIP